MGTSYEIGGDGKKERNRGHGIRDFVTELTQRGDSRLSHPLTPDTTLSFCFTSLFHVSLPLDVHVRASVAAPH